MLSSGYVDALVFGVYILALLWGIIGVTVWLERKRQQRFPYSYVQNIYLQSHARHTSTNRQSAVGVMSYLPLTSRSNALGERLPRQASPQQVIIHIEPDGVPTESQRNIQRLIQHFQKMPTAS